FINLPSLVERTLWGGFFLFTLILIVGVLTCRNLRLQRIALSVFLEAYLFLLFLFVFAWPKSQIAQHTFGTDGAVRRLPPQKKNVLWRTMMFSDPVESSGIVGKNFPFDVRIDARHRFETGNRVEFARGIAMAVVGADDEIFLACVR